MQDVIQLGRFLIKIQWLVLAFSGIIGYIIILLRLRKFKDIRKTVNQTIIDLIIIAALVWRFSLIFVDPLKVLNNPLTVFYFSGGTYGFLLSLAAAAAYLIFRSIRQGISILLYVDFMITGFLAGTVIYNVATLIVTKQSLLFYIGQSILAVSLLLWQIKRKETGCSPVKKLLPVIALVILIVWDIYGAAHFNNINNIPDGNVNNNVQAKAADAINIKEGIENGDLAPDFELTTSDGRQAKLSDYRGRKVILNFWATWCPPCKAEIPELEKFYSEFKDKNTVILGVDMTQNEKSPESVSIFAGTNKITYPVLLDKDGAVNQTYQVSAIPTSYIIDEKGVIRNKLFGPMDYETMKNIIAGMN